MAQRSKTSGGRKKAPTKSGVTRAPNQGTRVGNTRTKPVAKKLAPRTASAKNAPRKTAGKPRTGQNASEANVVRIKGFRKRQFNSDRPVKANSLLLNQLKHFQEMEQRYPEHLRTGTAVDEIKTEGQAGEYIRRVTLLIQSPFHKEEEVESA